MDARMQGGNVSLILMSLASTGSALSLSELELACASKPLVKMLEEIDHMVQKSARCPNFHYPRMQWQHILFASYNRVPS